MIGQKQFVDNPGNLRIYRSTTKMSDVLILAAVVDENLTQQ